MVEVGELSGFWLACGQLCSLISVVVPLLVIAGLVVLLVVAAWKLSRAVVSAVVSALREKDVKNIYKRICKNVKKLQGWG